MDPLTVVAVTSKLADGDASMGSPPRKVLSQNPEGFFDEPVVWHP